MFDANLRHLPNGHKFFAEVWGCKKECSLYKLGVRKEDELVLCEMLDNDEENDHMNPTVRFFFKGNTAEIKSWENEEKLLSTWIVYAGDYDLKGFLPQDEERLIPLAMKLLMENEL
tara:strand:+ start:16039 stop:16386 length:348 start_codon:yes stop_codon:yes gene_type:complete